MSGWILLHRQIKDHWLWKDPTKLKWWIDILLTVNHTETKVLIKGKLLICGRGESLRSLDTWAKEWDANKKAVYNFFKLLESDEMIRTVSETVTTRLTVCKYDSYNDLRNALGNGLGNAKETERKRKGDTNKEGIKNEEEGIKNIIVNPEFENFKLWILNNASNVAKMKEPFTEEQFNKIFSIYNSDTIYEYLLKMHNWAKIKNNVSSYLTLLNWFKNGAVKTIEETKRSQFMNKMKF